MTIQRCDGTANQHGNCRVQSTYPLSGCSLQGAGGRWETGPRWAGGDPWHSASLRSSSHPCPTTAVATQSSRKKNISSAGEGQEEWRTGTQLERWLGCRVVSWQRPLAPRPFYHSNMVFTRHPLFTSDSHLTREAFVLTSIVFS